MMRIDLTPFGFTPTESLVYEVLLTQGPGTGYAIARGAGLARANAYAALEGLVTKGAALLESGRPRRYRPESPTTVLARISGQQGTALERLGQELDAFAAPPTPTLIEITSARGALQLLTHHIARATIEVALLLPTEIYPLLAPTLRRPATVGVALQLSAIGAVDLDFAPVAEVPMPAEWPGTPIIALFDGRSAILAARQHPEVHGHWGTAPTFVAAATLAFHELRHSRRTMP